jgi:hypothetical protein
MKHLAQVQTEFLKEAKYFNFPRKSWDKWTLEQQREYLKRHPGSKKRLTGKPAEPKKLFKIDMPREDFNKVRHAAVDLFERVTGHKPKKREMLDTFKKYRLFSKELKGEKRGAWEKPEAFDFPVLSTGSHDNNPFRNEPMEQMFHKTHISKRIMPGVSIIAGYMGMGFAGIAIRISKSKFSEKN